jgi:hypothetical protein
MLQTIDGREVYVVEFDTMPELPITWNADKPEEEPYAQALARAIHEEMITEPGKYGVHIEKDTQIFYVFKIIEEK